VLLLSVFCLCFCKRTRADKTTHSAVFIMKRLISTPACLLLSLQLHILLCLDQYGRWGMDGLARASFLFLQQSRPLQLADWPGYTPRR
jgi:hypothetical protein